MRIFVAGGTGVIGRRAVPLLIEAGHEVTAAGRDPGRRARLESAGARVVVLDLFDASEVRRAVEAHDVVINLATHMPSSLLRGLLPGGFRQNDRVRREGAANLAAAVLACGVGRYVQESFAPVYEDGGARWLTEGAPVRPVGYNTTVLDAEAAAARVTEGGRIGVTLRFAYFYGPDSNFMREQLPLLRRRRAPLPGAPDAYVSTISHDDAARAVVAALALDAGIYNVCDDEPLTRAAYFAAFAGAFGLAPPRPMPRWQARLMGAPGELLGRSQRMSNRKLRAHDWAPVYPSAREGLRATAKAMTAVH